MGETGSKVGMSGQLTGEPALSSVFFAAMGMKFYF